MFKKKDETSSAPKKKLKKWQIVLIVIVILGIFGSLSGGGDDSKDTAASTATEEKEDEASKKEETKEEQAEESEPEEPQVQTWSEGMYKVGTDIPAGEYVLIATTSGYFEIDSDSTGTLDSIIANDNFNTNTIVTISDGQYFTLTRCVAYNINEAPALDTTKEGMFKVGKDLPAGEYKIHSDESGYVEVSSNSSHVLDSIVSNDNFTGDSYITVSDGQYLTLTRAYIVQ